MTQTIITENPKEAIQLLSTYDFSTVSFDVETLSTNWYDRWCHGGSYEQGNPTGISFYNGEEALYIDTCEWTREQFDLVVEALKTYWQNGTKAKGTTIIAHNLLFDIGCVYKYGIKLWGAEWFDTLTAAHLVDENRSSKGQNGLKALAKDLLGEEETIPWTEARFNKDIFQKYAVNDSIWAFLLSGHFSDEMKAQGLKKIFREIEMPFQLCLLQMKVNGVLIDLDRVNKTAGELAKSLAETQMELLDYLEEPYETPEIQEGPTVVVSTNKVNFNSPKQLSEIMFDRLGLDVIEYTPTGNRSTGKATLKAHKNHPFIIILNKYKIIKKLLTAFFNPLPKMVDPDGRLRPDFRNTGTVTGRLSCRNPNLQQLPKVNKDFPVETRACFIVPEGYKMVACDFSQQETRIMAELSQDPTLINILLKGGDIHLFSANSVFQLGIPEEKMYTTHPEYESIKEKYASERNKGKIFSFGVPYGMTEHKAAKDFGVTPEEGKKLMDNFFAGFPELSKAIARVHKQAQRDCYVRTYTGRKRRFIKNFYGRLDEAALRQSFNFLIQSFGADLMRLAQIKLLVYSSKHPEMEIKQLMSVHDEVVLQVKEEYAERVARISERIFESVWKLCVPLEAKADIGINYEEAK